MNRRGRIRCAALILLAWITIPGACASQPERDDPPPVPADLLEDERNTIELFRRASGSVVYITAKERQRDFFTRNIMEIPRGSGSGFVWDRDGHIVTNFHVVQPGRTTPIYSVTLADGTSYDAEVVGWEPEQDLAVLRIDAPREQLQALEVGDSDRLVVGQKVLAIGNPFGLDQTLTTGIISALGREIGSVAGTTIQNVIQTDASINPGNSGGPLLDSSGRVIGVNTAIISPTGSSAGIGFAVPVNTVMRIVPQLIEFGDVKRAGLGVRILTLDAYQRRRLGIGPGVVVQEVVEGSAADKAGLRSGQRDRRGRWHFDLIVAIAGKRIESYGDLYDALAPHEPGDRVKMRFVRDRREYETDVVLQEIQ
ncbi:MAG: trypsin-like peptidase domain-containing protein [Candidatus Latescibacterota bacterium]|nr:MAG: trypsin-like peptidase domain-containing protein [Candidatus Latescibacterota bacterium]